MTSGLYRLKQYRLPCAAPGSQGARSEHIGRYVSDEQRREPGPPRRVVCVVGWDAGCPAWQAVLLQPIQATSQLGRD